MNYRIVARQTSTPGPHDETYQVVDDEGREYCANAGGGIEDTPFFSLAVERYCELTGEDPDAVDGFHTLEIDGIEQTPVGDPTFKVIEHAKADAALFVEEWGEPLDSSETDWDAEAWSDTHKELGLDAGQQERLWSVYRDALVAETERLAAEA